MVKIFVFIILLPYLLIYFINEKEKKLNNMNIIILMDVLFFVFFMVYAYILFYFNSVAVAGMSSDSTMDYMIIVYYRNFIGMVCSILYSFIINFKLMKKYLKYLNILKYNIHIFFVLLFLELFFIYYFVKLCHIW